MFFEEQSIRQLIFPICMVIGGVMAYIAVYSRQVKTVPHSHTVLFSKDNSIVAFEAGESYPSHVLSRRKFKTSNVMRTRDEGTLFICRNSFVAKGSAIHIDEDGNSSYLVVEALFELVDCTKKSKIRDIVLYNPEDLKEAANRCIRNTFNELYTDEIFNANTRPSEEFIKSLKKTATTKIGNAFYGIGENNTPQYYLKDIISYCALSDEDIGIPLFTC